MFRTDGEPLSGAERARVRGAVAANEPPDDPHLAQAAVSVARYGVSRRDNPGTPIPGNGRGGAGRGVTDEPVGGSTVDVLVWSSAGSPAITRRAEVSG
jgi:hypothetical protein